MFCSAALLGSTPLELASNLNTGPATMAIVAVLQGGLREQAAPPRQMTCGPNMHADLTACGIQCTLHAPQKSRQRSHWVGLALPCRCWHANSGLAGQTPRTEVPRGGAAAASPPRTRHHGLVVTPVSPVN